MILLRFSFAAMLAFCLCSPELSAQSLTMTTISSRWQDSFVEWEIFATPAPTEHDSEEPEEPEEELYGEFKLRWLNVRDDFSEWDYELSGQRGTIRQKWKDDPQQWELRSYSGTVITMRTAWNNDLKEWRVSDNSVSLNLRSRWTNQLDEWIVEDDKYGKFYLYTLRNRDPRDWAIEDSLDPDLSEEMRLALAFIAIFHSIPKM